MAVATQVTTFSDLYTDLQNRVREETGVTATQNIAKRFINIALHDMHIGFGEQFPWAERRAVLITHDDYSTGNVSVTQGSTALAGVVDDDGNSPEWATNNAFGVANMRAGGKITVNGVNDVYEIASVTDDTNAVLSSAYVGTTDTSAAYTYLEDEYELASDFLRPIDQRQFSDRVEIALIDRSEFRRRYVCNSTPGHPKVGTIIDLSFGTNTTPRRRLRLAPPPDAAYMIPYTYVTSNLAVSAAGSEQAQLSSDDDEPIVPLRYRHVIVMHALYHLYRDRKDDARSAEARLEYQDILLRITADTEIGAKRPRLRPRIGPYWAQARQPWSGPGAPKYDIHGRFDRLEW